MRRWPGTAPPAPRPSRSEVSASSPSEALTRTSSEVSSCNLRRGVQQLAICDSPNRVVLGHIDRPGLWQSVEARSRRDNIVFLPQLAGDDRLIGDLQISPQTFTPNGDGVNDEVEVRFALYKVDAAAPRVRVFDLLGREVAGFTPAASGALQYFRWDGRDPGGNIVPPGIYLCQIDAMAEAGAGEVLQTISVAY